MTMEDAAKVVPYYKKFFIVIWSVSELLVQLYPEKGYLPPRVPFIMQVLLAILKLLEGNLTTIELVESIYEPVTN